MRAAIKPPTAKPNTTLMVIFVLPNLTQTLTESGQDLPFITEVVIVASDFYKQWWWAFGFVVGGLVVAFLRFSKTKRGKTLMDNAILKIPGLNAFLKMMYVTRFGENLSTLISGGVPIVEALSITQKIVANEVYGKIIAQAKDAIAQGSQLSEVFARYPKHFPPIFTQMLRVGEKSGSLDTTLVEVVRFYQKEMDRSVDTFLSLIEPTMIVVLGLAVGGLMAALMLPLYQGITAL